MYAWTFDTDLNLKLLSKDVTEHVEDREQTEIMLI